MLLLGEVPGTFMIRASNQPKAPHTLSVIDDNRGIKHYRINYDPGLGFFIGENNNFKTLVELVTYYKTGKDSKIIRLTKPVPKSGPTTAGLGKDIWEVDREKIQLLSRLGQGFYGEVWKGIYDKNTIVAVKTFKEGKMDPQDFLNEANIMKSVKHKRLVQVFLVKKLASCCLYCRKSIIYYLRIYGQWLFEGVFIGAKRISPCRSSCIYVHPDLRGYLF